jgi:hypothetical protein
MQVKKTLWVLTLCSLVGGYQYFGGTSASTFSVKAVIYLQEYMMSQPVRQQSEHSPPCNPENIYRKLANFSSTNVRLACLPALL